MISFNFHVDEEIKVLFRKASSSLLNDLLDCLNVAHDAGNHQGCQFLDTDFTSLEVSDQHSLVEQHSVFALERFINVHGCLERGTGSGRGKLVLTRVAAHNFFLFFLGLRGLEEAIATKYLGARFEGFCLVSYRHCCVCCSSVRQLCVAEIFLYEKVHFQI